MERYFGNHGGRFVPEMLIPALEELERSWDILQKDETFHSELDKLFKHYSGRPTPLYYAENLSRYLGGAKVFLKLESLNHTGAHKINNVLGQALITRYLGKKKLIAETGAGQHGVAVATAAAKFNMECTVFMGEVDIQRQYPNVFAMKLLGAEVIPVKDGTKTLKDAVNAALKYWITNLDDTHYLLGSALGPHPFPTIVRDLQSVIGREVQWQLKEYKIKKPDLLIACVGGGSNSIGLFHPFLKDKTVKMIGVEAGGRGIATGYHAARLAGRPREGIVQGYKSYFLQDSDGQLRRTHSICAGLDYAGIGPEHAYLFDEKRVTYTNVTDSEAMDAFELLAKKEGIISALESSHALAQAVKTVPSMNSSEVVVVNISGRGEKDLFITARELDSENWINFLTREVNREQ